MKRKKSLKHKMAEIAYKNPVLEKKINTLEKSLKEISKIINEK